LEILQAGTQAACLALLLTDVTQQEWEKLLDLRSTRFSKTGSPPQTQRTLRKRREKLSLCSLLCAPSASLCVSAVNNHILTGCLLVN